MRSQRPIAVAGRSAFTLLEVLLALSLSVVLLGAVFLAMDQTWKMTASGREEMERSQLARSLLRKMALDIRSIAFVPPLVTESDESSASSSSSSSSSSSNSSGSSSNSNSSSNSTTSQSAQEEEPTATSIGIRGTAVMVEMHISRALRELEFSAAVDGNKVQSRTSDLRVVTYRAGGSGVGTPTTGTALTGLIRSEGDRLATQMVEEKGGTATALSTEKVLASEVSSLQFRYFDGVAWYTTWDSQEAGRLPRAVEITMQFAPAKNRAGPALNVEVSSSANTYRSVVLIPISDPLPEEFVP